MAAPMKVVHDTDCSAAPTLDLQLSTTVQTLAVSGTLTVGGTDYGGTIVNINVGSTIQKICYRETVEAGYCNSFRYLGGGSSVSARLSSSDAGYNADPVLGMP